MSAPSHSSSLHPTSGFHPTLSTSITSLRPLGNDTSTCSLQLLYTFSSSIILDQYQLRQLHNEGRLVTSERTHDDVHSTTGKGKGKGKSINAELYLGGQLDLEAPLSKVEKEKDSFAIISIPMAGASTNNLPQGYVMPSVNVDVEIPLHLRYQEPVLSRWLTSSGRSEYGGSWWAKEPHDSERQDVVDVKVAWPCVFWACQAELEAAGEDNSPYFRMDDSTSCIGLVASELRTSLPSSSPFHPSTTHPYHYLLPLSPSVESAGESHVSVPTGVMGDLQMVSMVNLAATWIGFSLVAWKTWSVSRRWKAEAKRAEAVEEKMVEKKSQ